jgi:hypothetical protein
MIGMSGDPEGVALLAEAAKGDVSAQRGLIWRASELANQGRVTPDRALVFAEPFARMAAWTGEEGDTLMLAYIVGSLSELAAREGRETDAVRLQAEYIALLDGLADQGSEPAATQLTVSGPGLDPRALKLARSLPREPETVH